jgi:2-hydroxy-3-keto-5-methylthiopentenyl-1-phosphate phosphatase
VFLCHYQIMSRNALITDFDGTITRRDFYELAVAHCLGPDIPDYWSGYASGAITHFDAMAGIFSHIRCAEPRLRELVTQMDPDPQFGAAVRCLDLAGWDVIIVSNGSLWYIEQVLAAAGLSHLPVHANPGRYVEGGGLVLERPLDSPFCSPTHGIDKCAVVRNAMTRYGRVAFAGNGPPDEAAALLTPPELRFARTWLAQRLSANGEEFRPFERWSEIATALCDGR